MNEAIFELYGTYEVMFEQAKSEAFFFGNTDFEEVKLEYFEITKKYNWNWGGTITC